MVQYTLLFLILILSTCTDSNEESNSEAKKNLQGSWLEIYQYRVIEGSGIDSIHSTIIVFDDDEVRITNYDDSLHQIPETTWTGTFNISSDTIIFDMGDWTEHYNWEFTDFGLLLNSEYMIDINGVLMGDFVTVLWGDQKTTKKSGTFLEQ